jgi:hypothetical protein
MSREFVTVACVNVSNVPIKYGRKRPASVPNSLPNSLPNSVPNWKDRYPLLVTVSLQFNTCKRLQKFRVSYRVQTLSCLGNIEKQKLSE